MKKNNKTYLLLALVAGIWGTIGYRFISSMSSNPQVISTKADVNFDPAPVKEKDTFSIVADYRDPFFGTLPKKKTSKKKRKKATLTAPEIQVVYTGFMTDGSTKEKIFFVSIDEQQYLMSVKDEIEKIKLLGGSEKAIKIRQNNRSRTIQLTE